MTTDLKAYEANRCLIRKEKRRQEREKIERICFMCGKIFHSSEHPKLKFCSDTCKADRRDNLMRKYREIEENKERIRQYARKHYKTLRKNKEWMKRHAEKVKARFHEKMNELAASRVFQCKTCGKDYKPLIGRQKYCSMSCRNEKNKERVRARIKTVDFKRKRNAFLRKKAKRDPSFKLAKLVKWTVTRALKKLQVTKSSSVLKSLPYSIAQLKAHLEAQFNNQNGFTWENHGTVWHIDHIIPHSLFQYESLDSKAFRDCWALSNLRPLEKIENIRKSNRYDHDYQI